MGTALSMIVSVLLLGVAMKTLPMSTAYAIWVGIGAVGAVLLGVWLLDEPMGVFRALSLVMIVGGMVGLKLSS